jgi:hypothetical protein
VRYRGSTPSERRALRTESRSRPTVSSAPACPQLTPTREPR